MPCMSEPSFEEEQQMRRDAEEAKRKVREYDALALDNSKLKAELDQTTRLLCDVIRKNGGTAGLSKKYADELAAWSKDHDKVDQKRIAEQQEKLKVLQAEQKMLAKQIKELEADINDE